MTLEANIRDQLQQALAAAAPASAGPLLVIWPGGEVRVHCTDRNRLGCELTEMSVTAASLLSRSTAELTELGTELATRIHYLVEPLAVQEVDPQARSVQIRSTPPERDAKTVRYFEVMLEANSGLRLIRYEKQPGQPRQSIPALVSADVLQKICLDVIRTLDPAA